MNNIIKFNNQDFGELTVIEKDGEFFFIGKEVAEKLGYSNSRKAIGDHVYIEDRGDDVTIRDAIGRMQKMTTINESGLYSLILSSKLPSAKRFKHWVTKEVLPSIRKNGGYLLGQEEMTGIELLSRAILFAKNQIDERDKKIRELEPKAEFFDMVDGAENSCNIGILAKALRQNGIDIGRNRLFKWFRDNKYLIKSNNGEFNIPSQMALDKGLMEVRTSTFLAKGKVMTSYTPLITGKGQIYFLQLFIAD